MSKLDYVAKRGFKKTFTVAAIVAMLAAPLASTAEARGLGGGGHGAHFGGGHFGGGHGFGRAAHFGHGRYVGGRGYRGYGYGYGYDDGGAALAFGILGAVAAGVAASQFSY
jgi:hypothetical protein